MILEKPYREVSATEVLRMSINLYLARYELFLVPFLVTNLANGALSQLMYSLMPEFFIPQSFTEEFFLWLINYLTNVIPVVALFGTIGWVITTLSNGIAVKCSSDILEGIRPSLNRGFRFTLSSISSLLTTGLIVGVLTILGLILFIIPGVIVALMFSLTVQVIMMERLGVSGSLRRSRELVVGRWGKTFAVLLLVFTATAAVYVVGDILVSSLGSPFDPTVDTVRWLMTSILTSLVQPLHPIALTCLYYSLRIREKPIRPAIPHAAEAPVALPAPRAVGPSLKGFQPRFCYKCRQRLPSDAIYCPRCGVRVRPQQPNTDVS